MNYASIVPLIGGETIAMQQAFGTKPEYILSYEAFSNNDAHLLEYYGGSVPYKLLDDNNRHNGQHNSVDVINTVCPCAGLSSLSPSSSSDSRTNDWMVETSKFVLESIQPKVFWGENAPRLASKMGSPVVQKLRQVAETNGYTFSIFKTKSLLHGLSQVRDRTFYFFWKGNSIPVFEYIKREHEKIEDTIRSVKRDQNDPMSQILTNTRVPSENPFYKYVLKEIEGGITHKEFADKIEKTTNPLDYIESHKISYLEVGKWMKAHGYEREEAKCKRMYDKLASGGNIMRKNTEIPKDYIGAFVGHMPTSLTHPDEDRYLTIRECLSIMKMPNDFQLKGGLSQLNHICQNVPVSTAYDMAQEVKSFVEGRSHNRLIETNFLVQDNKTQTIEYEKNSLQLDAFMV
jgi:site-specific DNA-cytosine methylase